MENINILLDKLPTHTPSGLKIRTDFRECIKFELLMQDRKIKEEDKIKLALNLFYYEIEDIQTAIDDMIWFYRCGTEIKENKNNDNTNTKQIYSYEFDREYIYSAFYSQYNIDLNSINLHWWKFKALFQGLNDNNEIVKIMGYRAIDLGKIKDKDEKARYKKLKKLYALPDMRTVEEKEADFGKAFW